MSSLKTVKKSSDSNIGIGGELEDLGPVDAGDQCQRIWIFTTGAGAGACLTVAGRALKHASNGAAMCHRGGKIGAGRDAPRTVADDSAGVASIQVSARRPTRNGAGRSHPTTSQHTIKRHTV